jgi:2-haloacid dehalogenase
MAMPAEQLGVMPRGTGRDMTDLLAFIDAGCPQHQHAAPFNLSKRMPRSPTR